MRERRSQEHNDINGRSECDITVEVDFTDLFFSKIYGSNFGEAGDDQILGTCGRSVDRRAVGV